MPSNTMIRRLLLTSTPLRSNLTHSHLVQPTLIHRYSSSFPIAKASFWLQLIPKPLRRNRDPNAPVKLSKKSKPWNPGTFYIWIFLLIGSMAIQMIGLKMRFEMSMNRAEAKISLLKEVIERVQKGEEVDVDGLLGRGNKVQEEEWEEVLQEAEKEAELFKNRVKKPVKNEKLASPERTSASLERAPTTPDKTPNPELSKAPTGFY